MGDLPWFFGFWSEKLLRPASNIIAIKERSMISADITNPNAFEAEEKRKIVSIGLIQTTVSGDIAGNIEKTIGKNQRSFTKRGSNCLPSRTVQNQVFSAGKKTGCQQFS